MLVYLMQDYFCSEDIAAARNAGVIDDATHERLLLYLSSHRTAPPPNTVTSSYDFVHVLWYAGALVVLSAMGMFSTMAFSNWGNRALLATSVIYAIIFLVIGSVLWRRGLHTPGGLFVACAVGMTPLGVFAVQSLLKLSPIDSQLLSSDFYVWIKSSWIPMELATMATAITALIFFPFPFLTAIIAFSLWFLSMDLTFWLMQDESFTWEQRATISLNFGLLIIAFAWLVDLRKWHNGDFAFWIHLSGLIVFWGGLTAHYHGGQWSSALYGAINVGLVFISVLLMRRAYAVFGSIGVTFYLGYLSAEIFKNSILFPFALSGIGVAMIAFGVMFNKYGPKLALDMRQILPDYFQRLRPVHARHSD